MGWPSFGRRQTEQSRTVPSHLGLARMPGLTISRQVRASEEWGADWSDQERIFPFALTELARRTVGPTPARKRKPCCGAISRMPEIS